MSRPDTWMPLYIGDYLADTMHLTTDQHGAYLLLIMHYWKAGKPLPNDDVKLAAITRMSKTLWDTNKDTLKEFFEVTDKEWRKSRIDAELVRATELHEKRVERSRRANEAKSAHKETAKESSKVTTKEALEAPQSPSPSQSPSEKENNIVAKATTRVRHEYPEDFDRFWKAYPPRKGQSKHEALGPWLRAAKIVEPAVIISAAARFAVECKGRENQFITLAATWLNKRRWEAYDGNTALSGTTVIDLSEVAARERKLHEDALQKLAKGFTWPTFLGPAPGEKDCRIDPELLAKYAHVWRKDDELMEIPQFLRRQA